MTAAGWFPDPDGRGGLRYWDGDRWTDYVAPSVPLALADLATTARRANLAVLIGIPVQTLSVAAQGVQLRQTREVLGDVRDQFEAIEEGRTTEAPTRPFTTGPGPSDLLPMIGLPGFVIGVIFLIWFHRAATVALGLGRPARRSPGWAVGGWLIPIGNFFLPFQSARDFFAPHDDGRRLVLRWWLAYIGAGVLSLPLGLIVGATTGAAVTVAVGGIALVAWLFAGLSASAFIDRTTKSLTAEAAARGFS